MQSSSANHLAKVDHPVTQLGGGGDPPAALLLLLTGGRRGALRAVVEDVLHPEEGQFVALVGLDDGQVRQGGFGARLGAAIYEGTKYVTV